MIVKLVVSYDGSAYAGWQKQENALGIQEVMEKALEKVHKEPTVITASGRTDAKVHALGQVCHFKGKENIPPKAYKNALNALLPKDIRVLESSKEKDDFHARFSALKKHYRYVSTLNSDDPFAYKYKNILAKKPDLEKMKKAASHLIGTHDFTSYSSCKIHPEKPRIKTVFSIEISQNRDDIVIDFTGTGFLRYQVRMMSAVILAAGSGKLQPEAARIILEAKNKEACRFNADPAGLYLVEVFYE